MIRNRPMEKWKMIMFLIKVFLVVILAILATARPHAGLEAQLRGNRGLEFSVHGTVHLIIVMLNKSVHWV